ncbi:zinc knuckle CX2CX4HX4C [Artemisia annua]|uniref:Zinc knuckle CX2CX4HX4C n=1 Tax=Artemisia annua TaxID=35608 RepID=A0A2U1LPN6_ARTAN|nr:zinc knuckle CX2CX4HX4C [Artemisia annua]
MRTKRQIRPPQKLSDSDYSVYNTKSQKNVSKKGVKKDVMVNGKSVGEGDNCEGNNGMLNESEAIVSGTEEGAKCEGTESEGIKVVESATVNDMVQEVSGADAEGQESRMEQAKEQGDLDKGNKQNVGDKEEKADDQMLKKDNRNGDKTYATATTDMCRLGVGRIGYARVLVEVSAKKSLPDLIEVVYRDRERVEVCRQVVKVETEWVPPRCSECCVFRHSDKGCGKQVHNKVPDVMEKDNGKVPEKDKVNDVKVNDGFEEVRYKRFNGGGNKYRTQFNKPNYQYQRKGEFMQKEKVTTQAMYQKKNKGGQQESVNKEQAKASQFY